MREMKDSGVEWIGEIPEEWNSFKLKHCVICLDNERIPIDSAQRVDGPYPYWGAGSITDYVDDYIFDEDLVLLGEDGAPFFDPLRDVAHHINGKCWINNHIHVLRSKDKIIINSFLTYWLNSVDYNTYINGSILNKLTQSNMMRINVFTPSLEEQNIIASFLDSKCAEIDSLTAEIQKEIETLQEYRKSVITEAVTKGLDPNVEMKDSKTGYIGVVPSKWVVKRLRFIGVCQNGISKSFEYFGDTGSPFVSYSDVYKNESLPLPSGVISSNISEQIQYSVKRGDIFFTRTSETIEEIGFASTCLKDVPKSTFAGFLIRVRPTSDDLIPEFSKYYFRSSIHRKYFVKEMNLVTRASLGQNLLKNLAVVVPPKNEQLAIVSFLDNKCTEIDLIIADKQKQLETLAEYRKSLIYEYVTGKKEVPTS